MRLSLDSALVVGITLSITAAPLLPSTAALAVSVAVGAMAALASGVPYSQIVLGVGLLAYAILVRRVAWLPRAAAGWVRRGSFGADVRVLTAGCGLVAAVSLWIWYALLQPNIDDIVRTFVPDVPLWLLIGGGVLFSAVNAAVEEGAYRGVILHALDSTLGPGVAALVLQAMAFGALHIEGFPRGWAGVGLAAIYGVMMGIIKRRADGMLAPWVAHVVTDAVIVGILVTVARPDMGSV